MGNICSSTTPRKKAQHISQETLDEEEEKQYHSSPPKSLQLIPTPDTPTTTKASTQCAYMMPTFLSMAQKTPHLKVLDIGCGSGGITLDLAQKIPQGHITGYDICGSALSTARMRAEERGVRNVEFLKGEKEEDVYALPFRDAEFDVVYTHQAVAHFRGERVRARAIQEFLRVTKKNGEGVLCMREGDLLTGRFWPQASYGELERCFEIITKVHARNGGATDAGRMLEFWTVQAGVPRERVLATYRVWRYDTPEGRREYGGHWPGRCTHGAFAERARELGVTQRELDGYAMAWKKWTEDEHGGFAMMHGEVIARP